jgi:alpha-L-rhamnosidase
MVPWAVYESFGDIEVLRRQYDSMKGHVDSLVARQGPDGLLPESMQWGDWLDPDAPTERPWEAKADSRFLANAFFAHSARLLARAATLLGQTDDRSLYRAVADRVASKTWAEWGEHAAATQTESAAALCFDLVPAGNRAALAATLAQCVLEADGRIATGVLGTPLVLPALAAAGYWDEAFLMLLRNEAPSWLYQVGQGATTVWERWDAIRPDGSIHPGAVEAPAEVPHTPDEGHMLSFNHYAYGAVIDWVYRHLAGLAPDPDAPGYRHVLLAPKPARGIEWASASVETAYGTVSTSWRTAEDSLIAEVELPFGTSGTFTAPTTDGSSVTVDGAEEGVTIALSPGRHSITVSAPMIAGSAVSESGLPTPAA